MMPSNEEPKEYLNTTTGDLKLMADYTLLNFDQLLELDCYTYRVIFKDAFVQKMSQTEDGRDYLEQCWILTQTSPDRESLREKFNKE